MGIFSDVLLVSDYDDTLTEPGGLPGKDGKIAKMTQIPKANLEAIAQFEKEGGLFTIASGRTRIYYDNVIAQRITPSAPLVLANGAHVYNGTTHDDLLVRPMPDKTRAMAHDLTTRFPRAALEIQRDDNMSVVHCPKGDEDYYTNLPFRVGSTIDTYEFPWLKLHFSGPHDEIAAMIAYVQEHYSEFEFTESVPTVCEIQAPGVTKGNAARWLANRLGRKILVCVGDAPNDLSMLEEADYAFVPESGFEIMRRMGFFESASCKKGAVADVIRQMRNILRENG